MSRVMMKKLGTSALKPVLGYSVGIRMLGTSALKPVLGYSVGVRSFTQCCSYSSASKSEALKTRQEELMKRGLPKRKQLPGVQHVILVASGKGGVGKSTTAVNLAASLAKQNKSVGLLDADIFGPSIPTMMNMNAAPELTRDNKMIPLTNFGIKCMSIGFLVDPDQAVVWRGPMVMGALSKLLNQTSWDGVDILIVDTPPGTGDILLSLAQTVNISGALIVTTPQKVALADAAKGINMFQKVDIPVLGLVENMSAFICGSCGAATHIFGQDGVRSLAEKTGTNIIGSVPLDPTVMEGADSGRPVSLTHPDSKPALEYANIATTLIHKLKKL